MIRVEYLYAGYRAGQRRVLINLVELECAVSLGFSEIWYHFSKASLRLLVDGIDPLIDSLLLLLQYLGIGGLL
jgi:Co/Zn/Cd efflux system component